jgi:hypothetical protein
VTVTRSSEPQADVAPREWTDPAPPGEQGQRAGRLHRPWRALVALLELALAAAAVWLAFRLWSQGTTTIIAPGNGGELISTRHFGNWIALSIAAGGAAYYFWPQPDLFQGTRQAESPPASEARPVTNMNAR